MQAHFDLASQKRREEQEGGKGRPNTDIGKRKERSSTWSGAEEGTAAGSLPRRENGKEKQE